MYCKCEIWSGYFEFDAIFTKRCSSVVECRIRIPFATVSKFVHFRSLSPRRPSSLSCINEYLAIDSGGNVSE